MFVSLLSTPLIIQLYHKRNILSVSQGMISMIYFNLNVIVYANVIELPVNISAACVYSKYRINPTKIKHHLPSWNHFKRLLSGIVRSFERIYHLNWTGTQSFSLPLIDSLTLECFINELPVHRVTTWHQSCFLWQAILLYNHGYQAPFYQINFDFYSTSRWYFPIKRNELHSKEVFCYHYVVKYGIVLLEKNAAGLCLYIYRLQKKILSFNLKPAPIPFKSHLCSRNKAICLHGHTRSSTPYVIRNYINNNNPLFRNSINRCQR